MKNKILELLEEKNKALTIDEISDFLKIKKPLELKELMTLLKQMEKDSLVYCTKKSKYLLFEQSHLKKGRLVVNKKGFGFVILAEGEDVFISEDNLNGAIHDDEVIIEIIDSFRLKSEGRVVKIIQRRLKKVVGEVFYKNSKAFLKLDDEKIKIIVQLEKKGLENVVDGSKVLVELMQKIKQNFFKGTIIRVLGHKNDPGVDILAIVYKYGLDDQFDENVMNETNKIANEIENSDIKNRRDLRNEIIFTIDGDDTKDIDDALSLKMLKNNHYLLGVHIADVSYYLTENSMLDQEAFKRGTSVYLADRVLPMIPHKLSNGICSLNPNVDRLAISLQMEINSQGDVVDYEIFESVINSKKQMTYQAVNQILEEDKVLNDYKEYETTLKDMHKLAKILRKNKEKRGFIDFDIKESKIIVDKNGQAIDVKLRDRKSGEMLIEDFMILANETVASMIYYQQLPFVYRVHGVPTNEKIENFIRFVRVLGYQINLPKNLKKFTSKDLQNILQQLADKKEYPILAKLLLRSMQKAVYDKNNIGHFGLASSCYTHFTSPIRRYPDLTVHRLIRKYLFMKKNNNAKDFENRLGFLTDHCSQKERSAIECEREVDDMKKAEYMEQHIGKTFDGIVSSVMSFGLFVELDNGVEGLIKIDDLPGYFEYDEQRFSLKNKNKVFRLGDEIKVTVKSASKKEKAVDFILADDGSDGNGNKK